VSTTSCGAVRQHKLCYTRLRCRSDSLLC
jgi:hypothetical protein